MKGGDVPFAGAEWASSSEYLVTQCQLQKIDAMVNATQNNTMYFSLLLIRHVQMFVRGSLLIDLMQ